jgi:hypothetical protein
MLTYEAFVRHAEKVTKKAPESKPILQGIYHHPDGSVIVTDSRRIYQAFGIGKGTGEVITPKGKVLIGKYPAQSVDDFISGYPIQELEINVDEWWKATDIIYHTCKSCADMDGKIVVDFRADRVLFSHPDITASYTLSVSFNEPVSFNVLYILEAMRLFRAAKYEHITLKLYGKASPALFETDDIKVLILPVRRG